MLHFERNEETENLIKYFVKTYLVCQRVYASEPVTLDENNPYGDYRIVDNFVRDWIARDSLQNRDANFPVAYWNLCNRLHKDLSRTNNSMEAWHHIWGSHFPSHPILSAFVRRMLKEDEHWMQVLEDFELSPGDAIRGRGIKRKEIYIEQDRNLRALYRKFDQKLLICYLKAVSYHLHC